MNRNAIRIVCNPGDKQISYYFRNELGEWLILSGSSPLSRQFYTKTTIEERCGEIIKKADQIYNRKNKGLDIFYEGSSEGYTYLQDVITKYFQDRDIVCKQRITRIAIVGKKKAGKTYLIKGIGKLQKQKFAISQRNGYVEYFDENNNISWCEVEGVDLGFGNVEKVLGTIREIMKNDLSTVIYCVSGISGRIEDIEREFILEIKNTFLELSIMTVVTMCYKDDTKEFCDEVEKLTDHMEVFPVLAKEYKGSNRGHIKGQFFIVKPYGLDILCTYIFEGKKVQRKYEADSVVEETDSNDSNRDVANIVESIDISVEEDKIHKHDGTPKFETIQSNDIEKANSKTVSEKSIKEIKREDGIDITTLGDGNTADDETKRILIAGKKSVGKTVLIEGIERKKNKRFERIVKPGKYRIYEDKNKHITFYEIEGIDLGKDEVERTYEIIKNLMVGKAASIAYCISAETGKIEDIEKDLIDRFIKEFPKATITIILTMCYKENVQEIVESLRTVCGGINVIQTLAREYKTGIKDPKTGKPFVIQPFGLDEVYELVGGTLE